MVREAIVRVPHFLASRLKMASSEMFGTIIEENERAIHFKGRAHLRESKNCLRCNREITEKESFMVGYGPECSERIGIPSGVDDWDTIKEAVHGVTAIELWLPRSKVDILEVDAEGNAKNEPQVKMTWEAEMPVKEKTPVLQRVQIYTKGKHIFLKAPFTYNEYCKAIPGYSWDRHESAWKYFASPSIAETIMTYMMKAVMDQHGQFVAPETDERFDELVKQNIAIASAAVNKTATEFPPIPITKFQPWLHQAQAYWFAYDLPGVMLAMDMGTGKSKVTVDTIINKNYKRTLIMGPRAAVAVWPKEFRKHSGKPAWAVNVVSLVQDKMKNWTVARKVKYAQQEIELAAAKQTQIVICINYEAAWRSDFAEWAMKQNFDCVVCDESHKIKAPNGKASRFAARIGEKAEKRMALTGTPMPNSPMDVYGQYRFLDPGIYGTNHSKFKARYGVWGGFENRKLLSIQREDELNAKFYSIAYRVGAEVLDLPEAVHMTRIVQINDKARKFYKNLEKDLIAEVSVMKENDGRGNTEMIEDPMTGEMVEYSEFSGAIVTVENALTKLLRLQQITSGYIQDDDGELHQVDTSKEDALEDILDDIDVKEPIIVFAKFRQDLDRIKAIAEKTGRRYGEVSGRQNDLVDASMPENVDLMGVQIQAGGAGVDLTRSAFNIYYSVGFSLADYEQSLRRSNRPGQTRSVRFIHIIAEKTVDEKVYGALETKKKVVDYVLSAF